LADVAVVGAGLGGLATAARLAKLGHRVTVYERGDAPGGLLEVVRHENVAWDATPMLVTIPAVLRDLFRKSGRPLERYVDLRLSRPPRRHVFEDGTTLDLPTGSRGAQLDAVSGSLGAAAGQSWTRFLDRQEDVWTVLRSEVLDRTDGATALAQRRLSRALNLRQSLDRLLHKTFDDRRLIQVASYSATRGSDARGLPALRAVDPYLERLFGVWRTPGGAGDLAEALLQRMAERSVDVRFGAEVAAVRIRSGRACGVELVDGSPVTSDLVVTAVSPRQVLGSLLHDRRARQSATLFAAPAGTEPAPVTLLGLAEPPGALPAEVVLHGDPLVVVSMGAGDRPETGRALTVTSSDRGRADVLDTMAQRGLDLRPLVTSRTERSGSVGSEPPWPGGRGLAERAAWSHPVPGLHCLGTGLLLGSGIASVAWQAAHVAELIGPAEPRG